MDILRNCRIVGEDGIREADVGIEGGRVVEIGDVRNGDGRTIDLAGDYLAPGLIDCHVHLIMDPTLAAGERSDQSKATYAYNVAWNLRRYLASGVTTVRDLGGPGTLTLEAAEAVREGRLVGPDIIAAGENITATGGHGYWLGCEADGETGVRRAARKQLSRGATVIKAMATGGATTEGSDPQTIELTKRELQSIVEIADAKGVPVAVHAHGRQGIENSIDLGVDSIEHGSMLTPDLASQMGDQGIYLVPTLLPPARASERIDEDLPFGDPMARKEDLIEMALDGGAPIAMGTDSGVPDVHASDVHEELELMAELGMSDEAVFRAATSSAADLLRTDDVGNVEEGGLANLAVLEENPRDDVSAWRTVHTVVKRGRIFDVDDLTMEP